MAYPERGAALRHVEMGTSRENRRIPAPGRDRLPALSIEGIEAVVWVTDPRSGRPISVSAASSSVLGCPAEAWLRPGFVERMIHPADRRDAKAAVRAAERGTGSCHIDVRVRGRHGGWIWTRSVVAVSRSIDGGRRLKGVTIDVTQEYRARAELLERANTDQLTGLPNRASFETEMRRRLAAPGVFTILLIDSTASRP